MAAPGQAVPGTIVTGGSIATPGGPQGTVGSVGPTGPTGPTGPQGTPGTSAATLTVSSFTVPNVGATTTVTVGDASWMSIGQMLYVATAGGSSSAGALQVTAKAGNVITLLNPAVVSAIPIADNTQSGLLDILSGNASDYVGGDNNCYSLTNAVAPVIWYVRARSYSSIGNPNFEVNQRLWAIGAPVLPANGAFLVDRWSVSRSATISATFTIGTSAGTSVAPGSNFMLGGQVLVIQLGAQQTTLAAGDYFAVQQTIEGSAFRELQQDVHSLSLLINTNAALNFSVSLRNAANTSSLVIPVSAPSGVSLLTFPNLPVWPGSSFSNITGGTVGYTLSVCFAAGSTFIAPATGSWQSGNYLGVPGMDNFLAKPVGNNVVLSFIQHESGYQCSSLIDKPFSQNLSECMRYYWKSSQYGEVPGSNATGFLTGFTTQAVGYVRFPGVFPVRMAKAPTIRWFGLTGSTVGTANAIRNDATAADVAVASQSSVTDMCWGSPTIGTATGPNAWRANIDADTGW